MIEREEQLQKEANKRNLAMGKCEQENSHFKVIGGKLTLCQVENKQ